MFTATPIKAPDNYDNDPYNDVVELNDLGRLNPLNPAAPLGIHNGRAMVVDREAFETLSHRDNFPGAEDVREVKFLVFDVHTDSPRLFFINSNTHEFHVRFAQNAAGYPHSHGFFNNTTYFTNTNRHNVAGSLVAHDNYVSPEGIQGMYTLQCWPTDPVAARFMIEVYEMIAAGSERPRAFLLLALVCTLQDLSGHVQIAYYSSLVYLAWFAGQLGSRRLHLAPWFLGSLALGHLGGAAQLLPTWELVSLSERAGGASFLFASDYAYDPINWQSFFVPYANGDAGSFTYSGQGIFWESYGYVGVATLGLAAWALVTGWRQRTVLLLGLAALLAYLMVLGAATPFFRVAFAIPGMSYFRFPTRFLLVVDLALCLLAALGATRLLADLRRRQGERVSLALGVLLALVVAADLYHFQPRQNAIVDLATWREPPAVLEHLPTGGEPFRVFSPLAARAHTNAYRRANGWQGDLSPYVAQRELLQPNGNVLHDLQTPDGYNPITPHYVVEMWGDMQRPGLVQASFGLAEQGLATPGLVLSPAFHTLMSLHNVRYLLCAWPIATAGPLAYRGRVGNVHLYENPDALPRAFVVGHAEVIPEAEASLAYLASARFEPRREAVVATPPEPAPRGDHRSSRARIIEYTAGRVAVEVEAMTNGLLVLADTWYPGWEARVDGTPTPVLRANHTLRAVSVPGGRHEVVFEFRPKSVALGAALSGLGLSGILLAAVRLRSS